MIRRPLKELVNKYDSFCVGSLPFLDEEEAVSFVLDHPSILPFWPELPKRSPKEQMMNKAKETFSSNWNGYKEEEASGLYAFKKRTKDFDIIKCQQLGPLTFASVLISDELSFVERFEAGVESCWQQIYWQREFLGDKAALVFVIDEPCLAEWETLTDQDRDAILRGYSYLYSRVTEINSYLGLHSCGVHAEIFLDLPFELYSFDAVQLPVLDMFSQDSLPLWQSFLSRGGVLCAGVVPAAPVDENHGDLLIKGQQDFAYINSLFPEFSSQILFSANCGHATSSLEWVKMLY